MNKNKYIWNWTVVAKLAPEYKKYLEEENINHIKDDYITRARIGAVRNAAPLRTEDLNDAEMDIVKMMSGGDNTVTSTSREFRDTISEQMDCVELEPKLRLKPEYAHPKAPKGWYVPTIKALLPPKTVLDVGSEMLVGENTFYVFISSKLERRNKNKIILIHKHQYSHTPPFIRFIKAVYRFDPFNNVMSDMRREFQSLTYNYKTGNAYVIKNKQKAKKKQYHTHAQGILFNKNLVQIALSVPEQFVGATQLKNRFLKKMEEEVHKYVPDLFVLGPPEHTHSTKGGKGGVFSIIIPQHHLSQINEHEQEVFRFLLVLLQGKIKKRFQPPNIEFIKNLYSCLDFKYIAQEGEQEAIGMPSKLTTIVRTANYKRNMIRKIFRALRNPNTKNLPKTFLKTRFKPYKNLYGKLFKEPSYGTVGTVRIIKNIMDLEETGYNELKHIHHFLSYILSIPNNKNILRHIDTLLYVLTSIHDDTDNSLIVNAYLRTYKRILINESINIQKTSKTSQEPLFVDWARWKETYSMGAQLGIRIRPNKFRNTGDVDYLHDKFSEYFQRDNEINRDYNGFEFLEFKSPDKEYSDSKGNKFKFIQIRTASELVEEGKSMHHCVGSYAPHCAEGTSIIFSMNNGERSYVTVELKGNSSSYELGSVYTIKDNVIINNSINEIINEWHKDCLELHKEDTISYFVMSEKLIEKFRLTKQLELQNEYRTGEFGNRTEGLTKRLNELITEIQEIKKVGVVATNTI